MTEITLARFASHERFGMIGEVQVGGLLLYTVEQPWRDNRVGVSAIPEGTYTVTRGFFNRGGYPAWDVQNVPGRSLIKIHRANVATELRGCIAPGMALATFNGVLGVSRSRDALDWWLSMPYDTFQLTITNTWA